MATRATIVVSVPTEMRTKEFIYDEKTPTVVFDKAYAEVYTHWDGYPDGLGLDLKDLTTTAKNDGKNVTEEILRMISGGDMSVIYEPYHSSRGEDWMYVQPKKFDEIPNISEDYQYLWDGKDWYYRSKNVTDFTKL